MQEQIADGWGADEASNSQGVRESVNVFVKWVEQFGGKSGNTSVNLGIGKGVEGHGS